MPTFCASSSNVFRSCDMFDHPVAVGVDHLFFLGQQIMKTVQTGWQIAALDRRSPVVGGQHVEQMQVGPQDRTKQIQCRYWLRLFGADHVDQIVQQVGAWRAFRHQGGMVIQKVKIPALMLHQLQRIFLAQLAISALIGLIGHGRKKYVVPVR